MKIKTSTDNHNKKLSSKLGISFAKGIAVSVCVLFSLPLLYTLSYDQSTGYLSLLELFSLILLIVGIILFILLWPVRGYTNPADRAAAMHADMALNITRIRYHIEKESMKNKF